MFGGFGMNYFNRLYAESKCDPYFIPSDWDKNMLIEEDKKLVAIEEFEVYVILKK